MDITEVMRTSFEAIRVNKLRSSLTALGIIIGVAAIILLISIGSGLQAYISKEFEKLGTNSVFVMPGKIMAGPQGGPPRSVNKLTFGIVKKLESGRDDSILEILPLIEISATASNRNENKITTLLGTKASYFSLSDIKAQKGRLFTAKDDQASRKIAVIGKTIAADLYPNEEPVGKTIKISQNNLRVIGVLEPQGNVGGIDIDNQVIVPLNTGKKLTGADQVNSILIRTTSNETINEAKSYVEKVLKKTLSDDDYTIMTQEQLLSSILQILSVLTLALGGIAAISLIVGGVGISNIMLVSVTERTREIGLRKAVGAKPKDILSQFLAEAAILSLFGGVAGVGIGYAGSVALSSVMYTTVPIWAMLLGLGFSLIVGITFGVAPAIRASRLQPIAALRYE